MKKILLTTTAIILAPLAAQAVDCPQPEWGVNYSCTPYEASSFLVSGPAFVAEPEEEELEEPIEPIEPIEPEPQIKS